MQFDNIESVPAKPPAIRLVSCVGVDLELPHLQHFLQHYHQLGVQPSHMHVLLNTADPASPRLAVARDILTAFGVVDVRDWIAAYTSDSMWEQRRLLQQDIAHPGDWLINADVDEHHAYPAPIKEICDYCRQKGYNGIQGFLIDRLARNGELLEVTDRPELAQQFPLEAEVNSTLIGSGQHHGVDSSIKLMLHSHDVLPGRGGHNPSQQGSVPRFLAGGRLATFPQAMNPTFRFNYPFRVDHYKWTSTRKTTYERRIATPGASPAGLEEGSRVTRYLNTYQRVRPEDVHVRKATAGRSQYWRLLSLRLRLQARLQHFLAQRQRRNEVPRDKAEQL